MECLILLKKHKCYDDYSCALWTGTTPVLSLAYHLVPGYCFVAWLRGYFQVCVCVCQLGMVDPITLPLHTELQCCLLQVPTYLIKYNYSQKQSSVDYYCRMTNTIILLISQPSVHTGLASTPGSPNCVGGRSSSLSHN